MFGDILTDEGSNANWALWVCSPLPAWALANFIRYLRPLRTIHGSAPDILPGERPILSRLSYLPRLLLRYSLGLHQEADANEQASLRLFRRVIALPISYENGKTLLTTQAMANRLRRLSPRCGLAHHWPGTMSLRL